jgi:hypothetical protein
MCFIIDPDLCSKVIIAKKDTRVYKILKLNEKNVYSPYKNFIYKPKKLYKTDSGNIKPYYKGCYFIINEGFHAYTTLKKAIHQIDLFEIIAEFFIPKGAKYYINPDDNIIVSNKIYWSGRIYRTDRWRIFTERIKRKIFNL